MFNLKHFDHDDGANIQVYKREAGKKWTTSHQYKTDNNIQKHTKPEHSKLNYNILSQKKSCMSRKKRTKYKSQTDQTNQKYHNVVSYGRSSIEVDPLPFRGSEVGLNWEKNRNIFSFYIKGQV